MQKPVFYQAKLCDLETVSSISLRAYEPAYLDLLGELPRPAVEDYSPWIGNNSVWLCKMCGEDAGALVIEQHTEFWMVWSVAVDPRFQGYGLGTYLLEKASHLASAAGVSSLRLHTNAKMVRNLAIYRKAGFYEIAIKPHPIRIGHELVYMQLDL